MDGSVHLPERQDLSDGVLLVRLVVGLLHLVLGEVLLVGGDGDLVFFLMALLVSWTKAS